MVIIYCDDLQGYIIFTSDGTKISTTQNDWKPSSDTLAATSSKVDKLIKPTRKPETSNEIVYYKNSTAVRDAGKAPLYKGDPGYSAKLDRDGDGVACE